MPIAQATDGSPSKLDLNTLTQEPRRSLRSCSSSRSVRLESSRLFVGISSFGRELGVSSLCGFPRRGSSRRRSSFSGSLFILVAAASAEEQDRHDDQENQHDVPR